MKKNNKFFKYVSQNIFAMIGMSCYIIADTFFISRAEGTDGITVLNLALPLYGIIFAIAAMIGIGSATRYAIARERKDKDENRYFCNAVVFEILIGLIFMTAGVFFTDKVMAVMGADKEIIELGRGYNRIFLAFAPAFMVNYTFTGFVRNDNDSKLVMIATLTSCVSNIILDYVFMYPMGMGMNGAALATSLSPIISILICSIHFLKKINRIKFIPSLPSIKLLFKSCQLGVASFVAEISSAVTTTVFNFILLRIAGNTGVAAYGLIANLALVGAAIFNGIAQGTQPLVSESFGRGNDKEVASYLKKAVITALAFALIIVGIIYGFTDYCVALFNSEHSVELASLAYPGMRIYFIGFIFASLNIVCAAFFGATEQAGRTFLISIMRGFVMNVISSLVLSSIFGITGVWLAFPVAEFVTGVVTVLLLRKYFQNNRRKNHE